MVASGKKIGKTFNESVKSLGYRVKWYASINRAKACLIPVTDRLVTGILEQSFRAFTAGLGVRRNAKSRCMVQQVRFEVVIRLLLLI